MTEIQAPEGYKQLKGISPAEDDIGPFFYRKEGDGGLLMGFRVQAKNCNGIGSAHGGVMMTFADYVATMVALSGVKENCATISCTTDFMGAALLLFSYMRPGGWFVGNLGIWIGIALIHGGGAFFIAAWSWRVEDAERADNSISEDAHRPSPKTDELDSNDIASFCTLAELLHSPSIGLMVAGAINCLSMLPWTVMAYRGMSHRGRMFGSSEEYVMVWLFVSAVVGIPIVFAADMSLLIISKILE